MHPFGNEPDARQEGSAIVIVMFVLALLTVIGISATNMATNELKISGGDRSYKMAFYHAESGVYAIAKWISLMIDARENEIPETSDGQWHGINYPDEGEVSLEDLNELLMGYWGTENDEQPVLGIVMPSGPSSGDESDVSVGFKRGKSYAVKGSPAASLGEGTERIGSKTVAALPYWLVSGAETKDEAKAEISSKYVKIDGISGGL
jgi:hypothetical protein